MDCNCQTSLDILAAILDALPGIRANIPSDYQPFAREIESMLYRQQARIEERHERMHVHPETPRYYSPN